MADVAKRRKREAFLKFPGDYVFALADHRLLAIEDDPGAGRSISSLKHVSVKGDVVNITGYDEEEFLSKGLPSMAWDTHELQEIGKSFEHLCRTGSTENLPCYEAKFRRKDGRPFWLRFDRLSQTPKSGNHMTLMHDVTTEVELREARQAREAAEKACADLSREVQAKLVPTLSMLERIKEKAPSLSDDVDAILEAHRTVTGFVQEMLRKGPADAARPP